MRKLVDAAGLDGSEVAIAFWPGAPKGICTRAQAALLP
jgi:hypothetical protein